MILPFNQLFQDIPFQESNGKYNSWIESNAIGLASLPCEWSLGQSIKCIKRGKEANTQVKETMSSSSSTSAKNASNNGNSKNGSSSSASTSNHHHHHHHHHGHSGKQSKPQAVVGHNNSISSNSSQSSGLKMKIKRKDGTRTSHVKHEVVMTAAGETNGSVGPSSPTKSTQDNNHSSSHSLPIKSSNSHKKKDKSSQGSDCSTSSSSTIINSHGSGHSQSSPEKSSPIKDGHSRISNRFVKNSDMVRVVSLFL